jgi:hypothetical protein
MRVGLHSEIALLLNKHSAENGSNTPDFILAKYLADCLAAYDRAVTAREKWHGREPKPVAQMVITNAPIPDGERCCYPPRTPLSPGSVAD